MSIFFSLINNYKVSDVATCYKLMPSTFFKNVNIRETGFSIEIELLSKFLKFNKSIIEVPIKYQGRSYLEGKKIKTLDGLKYLFSTIKYTNSLISKQVLSNNCIIILFSFFDRLI